MPDIIISPSVLACNWAELGSECRRMIDSGADWLHMDVMDGHFVPNIVLGAPILQSLHKQLPDMFMDCHMMVTEPERWVKDIAQAGGKSYTFHIEAADDPLEVVRLIKAAGMRAAVAINPGTPSSEISNELGEAVDMILVMTVWPGAGGQKFMKECMPKVAELRARFPDLDIEVDGGVGPKTIDRCADAGANVIVAGTAIFNADDPKAVIVELREKCEAAQIKIKAERERILNEESALSDGDDAFSLPGSGQNSRAGSRRNTPLSQPRAYLRHLVQRRSSAQLEPMRRGSAPEGGPPAIAALTGAMQMTSMKAA